MRIGMMVDAYKPYISGVTNFIALNKRQLEKLGHEVFVFTFGVNPNADDELNIIRSAGLPLGKTGFYLGLGYSRAARQLLQTMDVLHVHHPFLSGRLALRCSRPRHIPVLFTNHTRYDLYARVYTRVIPTSVMKVFLRQYLPRFYRACDLVIAPSEGARQFMLALGSGFNVDVIPNGVDLTPFERASDPAYRLELGFSPEDVVLVYVGRLGVEKNVSFLLDVFGSVAQTCDHARLLLVGGGPMRDPLQERAAQQGLAEKVVFTGQIPYDQVPRGMAAADIFVTASVSEVHPLTVIEAMAAGLPVLGITSPGVGDTVQDGVTGYLVPEQAEGMAEKMVLLVGDAERRQEMGRQARQAAQAYAIERTAQTMLDRYQRLVDDRLAGRLPVRPPFLRFRGRQA
jgi:glycosyltransferase involved in cell wall biosynthesis